ncbi:MAG: tRNA (N(6)-L-threonylcarbamoyladenosine(37)-C(2))-methylthiotransferase [Candidatus Korarchaeota archaeon]|nr:tRNA (N(6)-L-threonylcarbamoyladenosine(37)-C(2))-methylthiotransferase [Candidatus Korarchaeota archaeon]
MGSRSRPSLDRSEFRFYLETHGCSMNRSDSQIMESLLRRAGWTRVDRPERADILILNTCNVKTPTEQRMLHRAKVLYKYGPLIAAGCMAKSQPALLRPYSKVLVAPRSIDSIVEAAFLALEGKEGEFLEWKRLDKASYDRDPADLIGIVPIAEGCLGSCTYCITKLARGRLTSFSKESIIDRVRDFLNKGAVEIWLTAEDTGVYGWDIGTDLPDLLDGITSLKGEFRIRVGMMTPNSALRIVDRLLGSFESPKLYKFFHLPIQSGSNRILRLMGRDYTVEEFISLVKRIRERYEDSTISTDIIVGFPGETEEDFQRTLRLLEEIEPDVVNLSRFGPRPKTKAASLPQLPASVIKRRSKVAMKLIEEIKERRNEGFLGRDLVVLASEITPKGTQGRTPSYKPVALGQVEPGYFYEVVIEGFRGNYLLGRVVRRLGRAGLGLEVKVEECPYG